MKHWMELGMRAEVSGENIMQWDVIIDGPEGTPYEGGHFKVEVTFPQEYPMKPPQLKFATKIYHPSVNQMGDLAYDAPGILGCRGWTPSCTMERVREELCHLLVDPICCRGGNLEIAAQFFNDRAAFDKTARRWTREYAV